MLCRQAFAGSIDRASHPGGKCVALTNGKNMIRQIAPRAIVRTTAGAAFVASVTFVALSGDAATSAPLEKDSNESLIKLMASASTDLKKGLTISEKLGEPISAKFESENDTLQLSIYIRKGGEFFEAVIDHKTVNILNVAAIDHGEDLSAAKAQDLAMDQAKISLTAAVDKAMVQTTNAKVLQAVPGLKDGHPVTSIELVKDNQVSTIYLPLD
jgi:hypothetical protein